MFYDTHCIFVKGEGQQILNSIVEVWESVFKRECLYYFLYEVSGVVIPAEFIEIKPDFHDDKRILLWTSEAVDESLESMSPLLIFDEITKAWFNILKDYEALNWTTHAI